MRHKILIVDDEADARFLCSEILSEEYQVEEAENVADAIQKIKSFRPAIILTDVKMPGQDGIQLLKVVKRDYPEICVIILTGHGDKQIAIEAMRNGAFDFLEKPFEDEEILSSVERAVKILSLEKKIEEFRLRSAESEKLASLGMMSGGIAHEINTPLGAIMLTAQAIEKHLSKSDPDLVKVSGLATNIQRVVDHISKIIQSLQVFMRDSSKDSFELAKLSEIIENSLSLCKSKTKSVSATITTDYHDQEDAKVSCRSSELVQVIVNLINNSCDAIKDLSERWIHIEIENLGDKMQIRLTDSGDCVSQEVASKLFEPFYTTKGFDKGTGLGLYVSKGLIQSHGGTLEIDPASEHTSFLITLPNPVADDLVKVS